MRSHLILAAGFIALAGCGGSGDTYTLYLSLPSLPDSRKHMATFDAEKGGAANGENCRIAAELFTKNMLELAAGRYPGSRFWCEKGRYKA